MTAASGGQRMAKKEGGLICFVYYYDHLQVDCSCYPVLIYSWLVIFLCIKRGILRRLGCFVHCRGALSSTRIPPTLSLECHVLSQEMLPIQSGTTEHSVSVVQARLGGGRPAPDTLVSITTT